VTGVLAATGSARTLWYLTRGTGVVTLLLLTAVVVLGVTGATRWQTTRLPRFVVAGMHRNLSLIAVVFLAAHVITTIGDGFAPIGLKDAVIPFASPYRPIWLGLGTVAVDLLLAVMLTSMLRGRLGLRTWRAVHWLAYASFPVALVHSLGTGTDARVGWMQLLAAVCTGAVAVAVLWRIAAGGAVWTGGRALGAAGAVVVPLALFLWYLGGPGSPGWAARSGTPSALLGGAAVAAAVPTPPFAGALRGTIVQSRPDASGQVTVSIDAAASAGRVLVWIRGAPLAGGGVHVYDSRVSFGTSAVPNLYVGTLSSLDGTRLDAVLRSGSGASLDLALVLGIDRATGRVSGSLRGTAASDASALGAGEGG
jgi:methionine sulfoxide reductase heme-binding subunit